jgi:hypothetical protein
MEATARTTRSINSIINLPPRVVKEPISPINTGAVGVEIKRRVVGRDYCGYELKMGC